MRYVTYCSFCILLFVFVMSIGVSAQDYTPQMRFSLYGGAAVPKGDFGSTTVKSARFANSGFCAMIEGSQILNKSMNWISSVSVAVNSTDESSLESQIQYLLPGVTVNAGNNITTYAMTGVGFETIASPTVKIYGLGQIGLIIATPPDITLSYSGESITQTMTTGTAFAYGFGAGIIINRLNIGIRYYAGEPEHEQSATYQGETSTAKIKGSVAVLQLMFGFSL